MSDDMELVDEWKRPSDMSVSKVKPQDLNSKMTAGETANSLKNILDSLEGFKSQMKAQIKCEVDQVHNKLVKEGQHTFLVRLNGKWLYTDAGREFNKSLNNAESRLDKKVLEIDSIIKSLKNQEDRLRKEQIKLDKAKSRSHKKAVEAKKNAEMTKQQNSGISDEKKYIFPGKGRQCSE